MGCCRINKRELCCRLLRKGGGVMGGHWTGLGLVHNEATTICCRLLIMNEATTLLQLVSLGFVIKGWIQQGKVN